MDSTYTRVAPIIAKVEPTQTVSLQMSLFAKSAKELAVVQEVPQAILEANKRRLIVIERERLELANKQQDSNRLSLQGSGLKAPESRAAEQRSSLQSWATEPPRSSLPTTYADRPQVSQAKPIEDDEEDVVFDMKKLDDLDRLAGRAPPKAQESSWETSAQPVQSRATYWDKPSPVVASPTTPETYGDYSTSVPRSSAPPQSMGRSQSVAQLRPSHQQESPDMGMAQMQQWMSMMMTNPEAMAQMQHMQSMMMTQMQPPKPALDPNDPFFTLESNPAGYSGNDFRGSGVDSMFAGFNFSSSAAESPDLSGRALAEARSAASRNPFMTERKDGSAGASGFFNL